MNKISRVPFLTESQLPIPTPVFLSQATDVVLPLMTRRKGERLSQPHVSCILVLTESLFKPATDVRSNRVSRMFSVDTAGWLSLRVIALVSVHGLLESTK